MDWDRLTPIEIFTFGSVSLCLNLETKHFGMRVLKRISVLIYPTYGQTDDQSIYSCVYDVKFFVFICWFVC